MGLAFGIVVLLRALMRSSRIERGLLVVEDTQFRQMVSSVARIATWLVATNALPLLAFPAYSANYQLSGANYLFLALGTVAAIAYIVREIFIHRPSEVMASLKSTKSFPATAVWLALTLSLVAFALWQLATYARFARAATAQMLATDPHRELPEIMSALEGKVVMTNVYPSIVSFFTHEATFGGCELAAFPTERFNHLLNGGFEEFNWQGTSPLHWTVAGSGTKGRETSPSAIVITKESTDAPQGTASARMVVPEDVSVDYQQRVTLPRQPEVYELTGAMLVKTSVPGKSRIYLRDTSHAALSSFSDYHPGDGMWHLLTVKSVFPANVIMARSIQFGLRLEGGQQVDLDAAVLYDTPLRKGDAKPAIAYDEKPYILQVVSAGDSVPKRLDPYACHTAWIKEYTHSTDLRPAYYALFRSLYTGFTLCRENECLDRLENYVASRYRKVFKNDLVTIFSLEEAGSTPAHSSRVRNNDSEARPQPSP